MIYFRKNDILLCNTFSFNSILYDRWPKFYLPPLAQGVANEILNKKSGVLGISGVSSDFTDLEKAAEEGNERALLAIKVFAHKVRFYIGAQDPLL